MKKHKIEAARVREARLNAMPSLRPLLEDFEKDSGSAD